MAQDAELRLKVGLDLAFFRQQLAGLGSAAAGYNLPINFDRSKIKSELDSLQRAIKNRKYRIEVGGNLSVLPDQIAALKTQLASLENTKIDVGIGAVQSLSRRDAARIKTELRQAVLGEDQKILIPVSIKPSVARQDVRDFTNAVKSKLANIRVAVKTDLEGNAQNTGAELRQAILGNNDKIIAPVSVAPSITDADVKNFAKEVKSKFSDITVKVKAVLENAPARKAGSGVKELVIDEKTSYKQLQALYRFAVEAQIPFDRLKRGAASSAEDLRNTLSIAFDKVGQDVKAGIKNGLKDADSDLAKLGKDMGSSLLKAVKTELGIASPSREFKKLGEASGQGFEQGLLRSMEIAEKSATRQIQRMLDRLARMMLLASGMSASEINRQTASVAGSRQLPGAQWNATVPRRNIPIGPSETGKALPFGADPQLLRGTTYYEQKRLTGDILNPALKEALRGAANAFVDSVRAELTSAVRAVRVTDLGSTMRTALAPQKIAGILPAGVGREPNRYSRVGGGESRAEMMARRTAEAYARSALRNLDVMGASAGRPASPYSYVYRSARPRSAMVPYSAGGALVPAGGGGGVPPIQPPGGTGGGPGGAPRGGPGGFGKAISNINLPGTGIVRELGSEFAMATKQVLLFGTAYKALAFATSFPAQVGQAVAALQNFNNTLKAISPSAQEARASNQLILSLIDKYSIPLQSARDGFTKLYASMQPAGFKGNEVRDIFTGISKAAASFGMSADKVDRVNYAFAQMASKGQVMSEELKGQLGDVLPGAMAIFAEAAGFKGPKAIQTFSAALEAGAYKGEAMKALLTNVGILMNEKFGPGAEGAAKTFQGAINRMQNSLTLLYESFEPVAVGFLNSVVTPMTQGIKQLSDGFTAFFTNTAARTSGGFAISQELEKLKPVFANIQANVTALAQQFGQLAKVALEMGKVFLQIAGNPVVGYMARVYLNVLLLTTAIQVLNLRALIPLIATFARSAFALVAFTVQCARAGQSAQVMGLMVRTAGLTLRTFFASTGVGLVLVGLGLLIERFMSMNQKLDETRQKALGAADAIRQMSGTEARAAGQQAQTSYNLIGNIAGRQAPAFSGTGQKGNDRLVPVTAKELEQLNKLGPIQSQQGAGGLLVRRSDVLSLAPQAQRLKAEADYRETQVRFEDQQSRVPAAIGAIPPAPPSDKDAAKAGKAADQLANRQQQNDIDAANRQNALARAVFDGKIMLSNLEFEHFKKLEDARYNLQIAGLNSIQARQLQHQQELQKLEIQRVETVRQAKEKAAKAVLEYEAAQNTAAVAAIADTMPTQGGASQGGIANILPRTKGGPNWNQGLGAGRGHQGQDLGIDPGDPIHARRSGVVTRIIPSFTRAGNRYMGAGIKVRYDNGEEGTYGHVQNPLVKEGDPVAAGQKLATVFNDALNTHLHYELRNARGQLLNPTNALQASLRTPAGAGAPASSSGALNTMQRREDKASGNLQVEAQEQLNQSMESGLNIRHSTIEAIEQTKALIKTNLATIYPMAEQRLENDLLKLKNDLRMQGMNPEYIDFQLQLAKADTEGKIALKGYQERLQQATEALTAMQKKKKDGTALTQAEVDAYGDIDNAIVLLTGNVANYTEAIQQAPLWQEEFTKSLVDGYNAARDLSVVLADINRTGQQAGLGFEAGFIGEAGRAYEDAIKNQRTPEEARQIAEATQNTSRLVMIATELEGVFNNIGTAFGDAFKKIISGSATAKEALAGMFQSISDSFASMVAKMIAEWVSMQVVQGLGSIASALSPLTGIASAALPTVGPVAKAAGIVPKANFYGPAWANGGIAVGGFKAFASGGIVTGPTMGLVGEGRYNEAVVPLPDGKSIPVDLGGGAGAGTTNVIVNVDAKGTNAQGNEDVARQLGSVISVAVQSEIVRQQRPGGLLASSR